MSRGYIHSRYIPRRVHHAAYNKQSIDVARGFGLALTEKKKNDLGLFLCDQILRPQNKRLQMAVGYRNRSGAKFFGALDVATKEKIAILGPAPSLWLDSRLISPPVLASLCEAISGDPYGKTIFTIAPSRRRYVGGCISSVAWQSFNLYV